MTVSPEQRSSLDTDTPPAWRELQDFLQNRLSLSTDEFNRVSAAGLPTSERLSDMMDTAAIAFLVMTGEDEHADGSLRARENVVHEAGLFQGRLGIQESHNTAGRRLQGIQQQHRSRSHPVPEKQHSCRIRRSAEGLGTRRANRAVVRI